MTFAACGFFQLYNLVIQFTRWSAFENLNCFAERDYIQNVRSDSSQHISSLYR